MGVDEAREYAEAFKALSEKYATLLLKSEQEWPKVSAAVEQLRVDCMAEFGRLSGKVSPMASHPARSLPPASNDVEDFQERTLTGSRIVVTEAKLKELLADQARARELETWRALKGTASRWTDKVVITAICVVSAAVTSGIIALFWRHFH
jgi:hypothetical protein